MNDYLFALTDGGGTVPPELGTVRRLLARGHRVRVLADDSMARGVAATGAEFLPWEPGSGGPPPAAGFRDWELRTPWALARGMAEHMLVGQAPVQAGRLSVEVAADRPDLVVTSFGAFGAMAAAEAAGLRYDVLIPNVYPVPAPGLPPLGTGWRPGRTALGRFRDRAAGAAASRLLGRYVLPPLNGLRSRLGLPPLRGVWEQLRRARHRLVLTARSFDFPARLDPGVRYVGPVLDDPSWATAPDWSAPEGTGPLVLVALSSTFQDQRRCLQNVVDALIRCRVRGLVTTGPALDPAGIRGGDGITVVRAAPHAEVLERADLVVTHGGHGTVLKSLVADRPLLVLPHGRDQWDNATRVTARGAGRMLRPTASPARLARAVDDLLHTPSWTAAAQRLGAAVREEIAHSPLVAELERTGP
ncbi:glycosyltransferase [Pseudonocardia sp. NPDC049635]|uniref:glycosyltransferase n=1 Tax=Pseudonocardia sp. NPDC049635 TaxID=3155506 RepID=UPI0033F323EA